MIISSELNTWKNTAYYHLKTVGGGGREREREFEPPFESAASRLWHLTLSTTAASANSRWAIKTLPAINAVLELIRAVGAWRLPISELSIQFKK